MRWHRLAPRVGKAARSVDWGRRVGLVAALDTLIKDEASVIGTQVGVDGCRRRGACCKFTGTCLGPHFKRTEHIRSADCIAGGRKGSAGHVPAAAFEKLHVHTFGEKIPPLVY